jgi:predicted dehydrogenase
MEKYKIGVVGTGVGKLHLEILQQIPEFKVVGICGKDLKKTQQVAEQFKVPFPTDKYSELLKQDIDTIIIASPNDLHLKMFKEAAEKNLNIIIEKPAGVSSEELTNLIDLKNKNRLNVIVDHELRFHPLFSKIKQFLNDKNLGECLLISLNYTHNLFSNPYYKFSWMNQKERGGGQLGLMGTHLIDLAGWWLNFPENTEDISVKKAIAIKERFDKDGTKQIVTAEDTFALNLKWGGTIVSATNGTRGFGYKGLSFEIHCTAGFLIYDEISGLRLSNTFGKIEKDRKSVV